MTENAIGRNGAHQHQLKYGIDHFRELLDEAAGVDVYGHQGIAVGDYDGDGLEDFYVLQPSGLPNRLFHNNGDQTFTDQSKAAGLDLLDDSRSALFADLDNDGDQDLILITPSRPLLFTNTRGVFTLAAGAFPTASGHAAQEPHRGAGARHAGHEGWGAHARGHIRLWIPFAVEPSRPLRANAGG